MSVTCDPTALFYAVVEHLKSTQHIYDSVNHKPEHDEQFRLVCIAPNADDAARLAHLLRAMEDGAHWYSVCVAEPEPFSGDNEKGILGDNQAVETEPLNPVT